MNKGGLINEIEQRCFCFLKVLKRYNIHFCKDLKKLCCQWIIISHALDILNIYYCRNSSLFFVETCLMYLNLPYQLQCMFLERINAIGNVDALKRILTRPSSFIVENGIIETISNNKIEMFAFLLKHGNISEPYKKLAFQTACLHGSLDIVKMLLDINIKPCDYCIGIAIKKNYMTIVKLLLSYFTTNTEYALDVAERYNNQDAIDLILQSKNKKLKE